MHGLCEFADGRHLDVIMLVDTFSNAAGAAAGADASRDDPAPGGRHALHQPRAYLFLVKHRQCSLQCLSESTSCFWVLMPLESCTSRLCVLAWDGNHMRSMHKRTESQCSQSLTCMHKHGRSCSGDPGRQTNRYLGSGVGPLYGGCPVRPGTAALLLLRAGASPDRLSGRFLPRLEPWV